MKTLTVLIVSCLLFMGFGCDLETKEVETAKSGVKQTVVNVPTDQSGLTTEQKNVRERLLEDNRPGAIKHLYIISAYSGQVLVYSTVRGKVTSSGKRLSPVTLGRSGGRSDYKWYNPDLIQDDGTYGSSIEYVFWWDTKGVYHQQHVAGGMILHVSSQPLAVKGVVLNMELSVSANKE